MIEEKLGTKRRYREHIPRKLQMSVASLELAWLEGMDIALLNKFGITYYYFMKHTIGGTKFISVKDTK